MDRVAQSLQSRTQLTAYPTLEAQHQSVMVKRMLSSQI